MKSTVRPSLAAHVARTFAFDRAESLLLTSSLSAVLRDAIEGDAQDDRATVRPGASQ